MDHEVHKSKKWKRFEATWRDQESLAAQMNPQVPHPPCFPSRPSPFKNFSSKKHHAIVPDLQNLTDSFKKKK
jgi:hypothetical protein